MDVHLTYYKLVWFFIMSSKNKNSSYYVNWITTAEFPNRRFPIVYLCNGEISYSLTAYLKNEYALGRGKNTVALYDLFRVVAELTHYYEVSPSKHEQWLKMPQQLMIDYFSARLYGTIRNGCCSLGLLWEPLDYSIIKKLIRAFTGYEQFCNKYFNTQSMQMGDLTASITNNYHKWKKGENFSLLSHLHDEPVNDESLDFNVTTGVAHGNENESSNDEYRFFPPFKLQALIDNCHDVNQKCMYLLCSFAALRASEGLHLFVNDVVQPSTSIFSEVMLSKPHGKTWDHINDRLIKRVDVLNGFEDPDFYLDKLAQKDLNYVRKPIPRVDEVGKLHLGWKGITVSYEGLFGYTIEWLDDAARIEFERHLPELLNQYRANHPYLFCLPNGAPLNYGAYLKRFQRASFNLTGTEYSTHSLRHFSGFYQANKLKTTIETAKVFMRHKAITSTDKYYHLTKEEARRVLSKAQRTRWDSLNFNSWGI
jgi:hypothetical protein